MDVPIGLNTKTALEHALFLEGKNNVSVCKDLGITPQQFADWIKFRRPIPAERLSQLARYFDIPTVLLADDNRFARKLSPVNSIDLEMLALTHQSTSCGSAGEKEALFRKLETLEVEKRKQVRLARLAAILEKDDPASAAKVDALLNALEAGK